MFCRMTNNYKDKCNTAHTSCYLLLLIIHWRLFSKVTLNDTFTYCFNFFKLLEVTYFYGQLIVKMTIRILAVL